MDIEKLVEVGRELCKPDEQIKNADAEIIICQENGDWLYSFSLHEGLWPFTGWLLERLNEWGHLGEFAQYHNLEHSAPNLHRHLIVLIPIDWLTSPSILPEKVGEYIKHREENDNGNDRP